MPITNLTLSPGDRLLPCPFCGGTSLELQNTHTACYWIKCLDVDCGAEVSGESFTGNYRSENIPRKRHEQAKVSAIAAWNRRSTLAAPADAMGKVVAEVMDLPPVAIHEGPFGAEIDALNAITDLAMKSGSGGPREWLLKIVQVGLRGLACDAAKVGDPLADANAVEWGTCQVCGDSEGYDGEVPLHQGAGGRLACVGCVSDAAKGGERG